MGDIAGGGNDWGEQRTDDGGDGRRGGRGYFGVEHFGDELGVDHVGRDIRIV
jgi:hypothetical protein